MTTIHLQSPLKKGEVTIEELTFKEMNVGHLLAVDGLDMNTAAATIALASALTGAPALMFRGMGPDDWVQVRTEVRMAFNRFAGVSKQGIVASLAVELSPEDFAELIKAYAADRGLDLAVWMDAQGEAPGETP